MPIVVDSRGTGGTRLLDGGGSTGLLARRWVLAPGERSAAIVCSGDEVMLYVIGGRGSAEVDGARFDLETESLLWLEHGDSCVLEGGPERLEVLEGRAGAR